MSYLSISKKISFCFRKNISASYILKENAKYSTLKNINRGILCSLLTSIDSDFTKNENYQFFVSQKYDNLFKSLNNLRGKDEDTNFADPYTELRMTNSVLFQTFIEEKYGGMGMDHTNFAYLIERLGSNTNISYLMIINQLLCTRAIIKYGNKTQQNKYLQKLSNGQLFGSFCLHELSNGNNIHMMESRGDYCTSSQTYKVSAKKNWIYNAQFMNMCILFVKMKDKRGSDCISAFLKENPLKDENVSVTPCENVLNIHNVGDVSFNNVSFTEEDLLGNVGDGFKIAVQLQNSARFTIAASLLGITKEAIRNFLRLQLSSSEANANVVKWSSNIFAAESALYFTTNIADDYPMSTFDLEFAALKVQTSKTAFDVINGCIDLVKFDGKEDLYYRNLLDKIRGLELFLGSSDVLTHFIGGVAIQHNLPLLEDDLMKLQKSHENIIWKLDFSSIKNLPSFYKDCPVEKNTAAVIDCLDFLRKQIIIAMSQHGFNTPNRDYLLARLGSCLVICYHLLAVIGHHKLLSKDKISYKMEVIIKGSMDILRNELIECLGESYDRISLNVNNTKYRAISKIVTKNEVHGIESAITRTW